MRIRMMIMVFDCQYLLVMVPISPVGYFAVRSMGWYLGVIRSDARSKREVVSGRDQIRRTEKEGRAVSGRD